MHPGVDVLCWVDLSVLAHNIREPIMYVSFPIISRLSVGPESRPFEF